MLIVERWPITESPLPLAEALPGSNSYENIVQLTALDWIIILGYLVFALGVGVYYSRRAGKNSEEYFLAGRTLPWWVLGTSMVATTFAADTPLAITEMSRKQGIWENWFWWNWLLFGLLSVFLFARLWRRANVLTENELLELRYSGKPAAALRIFKAGYFSLLFNFIVMGWVLTSMASVMSIMLSDAEGQMVISHHVLIWILVVISVVYALLSGFWGVVVTDVVQFVISMVGAVVLAWIALSHVGGVSGLMDGLDKTLERRVENLEAKIEQQENDLANATADTDSSEAALKIGVELEKTRTRLSQTPRNAAQATRMIPTYPESVPVFSFEFLNSQFFNFIVLILVMWWSNHSTDGGGYLIQRTMAARDENHAMAANLWYNFANFALRTWPWVIVALVSIVMFDDLSGHELGEKAGYPLVMKELLGPGLRGLLLVSFLAAFMSTIDTHLNWGSSYLVHDIYRRFMAPSKTESHYVMVSRICTIGLMVAAALLATQMSSVEKAWKFVMAMGAGIGLVLILRWFWWRINSWSEISALVVSVLVTCGFEVLTALQQGDQYKLFSADPTVMGHPFPFHLQLLVVVALSMVSWISVTLLTKPEPDETLRKFYSRVQPGGWWGRFANEEFVGKTRLPSVARGFIWNFVAGMAFVWGGLFMVGYTIFGNWLWAGINLVLMLGGFVHIWRNCLTDKPALKKP